MHHIGYCNRYYTENEPNIITLDIVYIGASLLGCGRYEKLLSTYSLYTLCNAPQACLIINNLIV